MMLFLAACIAAVAVGLTIRSEIQYRRAKREWERPE